MNIEPLRPFPLGARAAMNPDHVFDLPAFDVPQMEPPRPISYETAMDALEEVAATLRLREDPPRVPENIPQFDI